MRLAWARGRRGVATGDNCRLRGPVVDLEASLGIGAPYNYEAAVEATDHLADELEGELARRAEELGVEVSFVRQKGDAAHVLTEVARTAHADLYCRGPVAENVAPPGGIG